MMTSSDDKGITAAAPAGQTVDDDIAALARGFKGSTMFTEWCAADYSIRSSPLEPRRRTTERAEAAVDAMLSAPDVDHLIRTTVQVFTEGFVITASMPLGFAERFCSDSEAVGRARFAVRSVAALALENAGGDLDVMIMDAMKPTGVFTRSSTVCSAVDIVYRTSGGVFGSEDRAGRGASPDYGVSVGQTLAIGDAAGEGEWNPLGLSFENRRVQSPAKGTARPSHVIVGLLAGITGYVVTGGLSSVMAFLLGLPVAVLLGAAVCAFLDGTTPVERLVCLLAGMRPGDEARPLVRAMANGMVYVAIDPGAERHDRQPNAMRRMLAGAGVRQPEANTNGMFIDAYGAAEGGTVTITVNHDDVERYLNALLNSKRFGFTPRRFWSRLRDAIIHRSLPDVAWGGEGLAVADRTLTESDDDKASLTVSLRRSTGAQPINVEVDSRRRRTEIMTRLTNHLDAVRSRARAVFPDDSEGGSIISDALDAARRSVDGLQTLIDGRTDWSERKTGDGDIDDDRVRDIADSISKRLDSIASSIDKVAAIDDDSSINDAVGLLDDIARERELAARRQRTGGLADAAVDARRDDGTRERSR
jgi:hypothetical protein